MSTTITDADRALAAGLIADRWVAPQVSEQQLLTRFAHHREESVRALEADKRRLDWLQSKRRGMYTFLQEGSPDQIYYTSNTGSVHNDIRSAIDEEIRQEMTILPYKSP